MNDSTANDVDWDGPDDLDAFIADRARTNPDFPRLVDEAVARRQLLRESSEHPRA